VALIVAVPGACAVTSPLLVTVATAAFVVDQLKTVPVVGGLVVAVSWTVCPPWSEAAAGDTPTDLTPPPPPLANSGEVGSSFAGAAQATHRTTTAAERIAPLMTVPRSS
jgi:hypothetical protein